MRNKLLLLFFTLLSVAATLNAQSADPVVFTINNKPVHLSEVYQAYTRGNEYAEEKQSIEEFLESYIDFKLNVEEARAQQLDTTLIYRSQYNAFRSRLAAPYQANNNIEEQFYKELYGRFLTNVEVNHVLLPFDKKNTIFPADTLALYQKAMKLYEKIQKEGFTPDILPVAKTDTEMQMSAENRNGYIGWITPLMLSNNVENAVYTMPLMEISKPIRTQKGYHIVQALNRRPAIGGVDVEQVVFGFPRIPPTQHLIDSVEIVAKREYELIRTGKSTFDDLCAEYTKVFQTGREDCLFGEIRLDSNLPPTFIAAAISLKEPGDISQPILSDYGFHIIRLVKKKAIAGYESMKKSMVEAVSKRDKSDQLAAELRKELISRFDIKINNDSYAKLNNIASEISPRDTAFIASVTNGNDILIDIEGKRQYDVNAFVQYISIKQKESNLSPRQLPTIAIVEQNPLNMTTDILNSYFNKFIWIAVSEYNNSTLEDRNPQFKQAMEFFTNQLLSSEVLEKNIWQRAKTDKEGLSQYFAQHKDKYSLSATKYKGTVILAKTQDALAKAQKLAAKQTTTEGLANAIRKQINKKSTQVRLESGAWYKKENPYIDNKIFGGEAPKANREYPYFAVIGKFIDTPEDYTDVRNAVVADYQEQLQLDWSKHLREKYKVDIDKSVLKNIQ
ncbi:peptidylprolyl isomerase [Dysgonomonas sp. 511]|uniref:peptidylprolyl isomerase n=1 Tax=Dysgonomonas sp. 511 TaxID=2302930 RepID=UPI0013D2A8F1|nr:peptidylprolyl isomerase [Dysgonomonas sp. 511]NDV79203.1 hypothetical protein [Dysgonomonas sp. 511]